MKAASMGAPPSMHHTMKPITFALLRQLVDGKFHSGEMLAQRLGISRASVSNALHGVADYGLALYSVPGRGYCLNNPPQWLDAELIARHLGKQAGQFQIDIFDNLPSSNTLMLQRAAQGAASGNVLAVELQSGGRGRLGRSWHSSLGNALTFSLLWRFELDLSALSGLSLAVGVALIRALRALGIVNARLKWPNDVLGSNDGKLAGILLEAQGDMLGPSAVVIGIGLNLSMPKHLLPQIDQPVLSLEDMVAGMPGMNVPERNYLFAVILRELQAILHEFAINGFAALRAEWESHHALQNQTVRLLLPDGRTEMGIARGVTDNGALILETAGGMQVFNAGEIGLRAS
ncbi:Bifunctional ligase/repressor BirA [Candidatus Nitrotoga sp. HW29]|uniref:biotin--[acetyl-CoA-carboxylase] ligase n=1 Tax=Candidatus Nitrotoga sp. HW29 TaxID=2886963 RepID=UPI001EF373EB|nr:biotin--[acetyl-CoA-carboxylase] ligase [Candidatus Nitrotoga sp. HW29]CAH1904568.1 Bifunctional ligase/repressor BirA [Candidatus Nitrotoga sp. HW29]